MRIPEIREELRNLAAKLAPPFGNRLVELADELKRRSPRKVARRTVHEPMTDSKRAAIVYLADKYPNLTGAEIAARVKVSPARVSEVLRGKRT